MRLTSLTAGLAVVVALGGCTNERTGAAPTEHGAVDLSLAEQVASLGPLADVPAASLVEPEPEGENARLIQQSAKNTPFCSLVELLDELSEPDPQDAAELAEYASRYYNLVYTLDPRSKVNDPAAVGGRVRKVRLPKEIVGALNDQRRTMYAYWVRLQVAEAMAEEGLIDDAQVQARLQDAFVKLVQSPYTEAERTVEQFRVRACGQVSAAG